MNKKTYINKHTYRAMAEILKQHHGGWKNNQAFNDFLDDLIVLFRCETAAFDVKPFLIACRPEQTPPTHA